MRHILLWSSLALFGVAEFEPLGNSEKLVLTPKTCQNAECCQNGSHRIAPNEREGGKTTSDTSDLREWRSERERRVRRPRIRRRTWFRRPSAGCGASMPLAAIFP
jgi:hypothetical protein